MSRIVLPGLNGANPLGFLASLGLLRVASRRESQARLAFEPDGSFHAFMEGFDGNLPELVAKDANEAWCEKEKPVWWLQYDKHEKRGVKQVADLKAPPEIFARYLSGCLAAWCEGNFEAAEYAAAFGTSAKPTALHFTAGQQQFLDTVDKIRVMVSTQQAHQSLIEGGETLAGPNLRWEPGADRSWALMAEDPSKKKTVVDPTLEWLAFRALPLFPVFLRGTKAITTAVSGREEDMKFTWPLWCLPASIDTVRSLVREDWSASGPARARRGVFVICEAPIRRSNQGYGNFGPATLLP